LQLDAPSRVRMPGARSDRATNARSIETGPFLTPRLAPTCERAAEVTGGVCGSA
jgi:hypothetical protein